MKQIKIKARSDSHAPIKCIACTVLRMYPRFVLLDNGMYRFCVDRRDLKSGNVILM